MRPVISWTKPKAALFEKAYKQTLAAGRTVFTFEGCEFVPAYAKYVIEYLKGQFK